MKWRLMYVAIGWILIVAVALLINGEFYADPAANAWRLVEAALLLGLILAVASFRSVWFLLDSLGPIRGGCLAIVLGLIGMAQVADRTRAMYPFVSWSMYSQPDVVPNYTEYRATLESGRQMHFPFHRVIPTNEPRGLSYNMTGRVRDAFGPPPDPPAQREVERLIVSLARTYNERNPQDPIRHVEIRLRAIPLDDFQGPESVADRPLIRYTVVE